MGYKSLVIGCGNIGAMYDLRNEQVLTHAKAFFLHPEISLSLFDTNREQAELIGAKYDAEVLKELTPEILRQFDIISLCVSTIHHYTYLQQILPLNIPVLICEKPLVAALHEVEKLAALATASTTKILVNYIRRFQPAFESVKKQVREILQQDELSEVVIKYQRGFLNNAGHAFDLIEFLTDREIEFNDLLISRKDYDAFPDDPTMSCSFVSGNTCFNLVGLKKENYAVFEIELYFSRHFVRFTDSGNVAAFFRMEDGKMKALTALNRTEMLKDYMLPVVQAAINEIQLQSKSNFQQALRLNKKLLKILNT